MNDERVIEVLASAGNFAPRALNYSAGASALPLSLWNPQSAAVGGIRTFEVVMPIAAGAPSRNVMRIPSSDPTNDVREMRLASAIQFWALEDSLPDNPGSAN